MVEDEGNQEEKFDFTSAGENLGYIGLSEARVLAMRHARENPGYYAEMLGESYANVNFVWELVSQEEDDDYYDIKLSFRPAGRFRGEPGLEHFVIDKSGNIEMRQILDEPDEELSMDDDAEQETSYEWKLESYDMTSMEWTAKVIGPNHVMDLGGELTTRLDVWYDGKKMPSNRRGQGVGLDFQVIEDGEFIDYEVLSFVRYTPYIHELIIRRDKKEVFCSVYRLD